VHALCAAIRSFVHDYIQQIADLAATHQLSLAVVALGLQQPIEMLQVTASIVSQVSKLKGCQIVSALNSSRSSLRGSTHIRKLLTHYFEKAIVPMLTMIDKWIFLGEIDDPHHEFFIRVNRKVTPEEMISDSFWDDRFSIAEDFVPKFIPPTVVDRIFSAGKSQSVLSSFSKEPRAIPTPFTIKNLMLEATITEVCRNASNSLISLFKFDHDLMTCFEALRKVFLCERGDWLCAFMRSADYILRRSRQQIVAQDFDPHICAIINEQYVKFIGIAIDEEQLAFALQSIHAVGAAGPNPRALRKSRITTH
jgi:gamma-tubulin complex component 3